MPGGKATCCDVQICGSPIDQRNPVAHLDVKLSLSTDFRRVGALVRLRSSKKRAVAAPRMIPAV